MRELQEPMSFYMPHRLPDMLTSGEAQKLVGLSGEVLDRRRVPYVRTPGGLRRFRLVQLLSRIEFIDTPFWNIYNIMELFARVLLHGKDPFGEAEEFMRLTMHDPIFIMDEPGIGMSRFRLGGEKPGPWRFVLHNSAAQTLESMVRDRHNGAMLLAQLRSGERQFLTPQQAEQLGVEETTTCYSWVCNRERYLYAP